MQTFNNFMSLTCFPGTSDPCESTCLYILSVSPFIACNLCLSFLSKKFRRMVDALTTHLVVVLIICCGSQVRSDESDHRYKAGDPVPLYANKVGPFQNPSETYSYFDLPYCSPVHVKKKKETLGEVLNGDRLISAPYKLDFLLEKESEVVCRKKLTKEEVSQFRTAVAKDYYFQMYYDDLPLWCFIGRVDRHGIAEQTDYKYLLFTHVHFEIFYNTDRVIQINARTPQYVVNLTEEKEMDVDFMYTVTWRKTNTPFEKRMEMYSQSSLLPHHLETHWFSVINSCATVLILIVCLVTFYMRVLRKDILEYTHDKELAYSQEETGWKNIHGDVFRYPKHKSLFAAALGSGTQLFILTISILILGVFGVFYPYNRGALLTAMVVIYTMTSGIAGYSAVSFYCQLEGTNWDAFFVGLCSLRSASLILLLLCIEQLQHCHWVQLCVWGHRIYTIYVILFIVFIILLTVTGFVTVALTYLLLAAEDHEWWWRSFLCGGSTGFSIYAYSFYYYYMRSDMSGLLQSSFFFGYMACICYGIFLMLGTIGFHASFLFVRHIYGSIKCE
ncbi:hypothetical protein F0562_032436 [Nyssa sinensis]|uniref:Transmembrane 9 superfamily member n=1 Tax=Nyssa sinensis TaxID=561372 RepID=A0A5J5AMQ1_9ASTE|nr:hypothetical protein F0562_032436 [Nyssa sinensis]